MLASGRWVRSVAVGAIADNSGKDLLKLHGALGVAGAFAPGFAYKVRGYRRFRISANEAGDIVQRFSGHSDGVDQRFGVFIAE